MQTAAITSLLLFAAALRAQAPVVQTVAGTDAVGEGVPATTVTFRQLRGIAAGTRGSVYIADTDGHRVHCVASDGTVSTVAGIGRAGFSGDGGPANEAALNAPYGLAVDESGSLFIADLGNRRIRKITPDGFITTVAGGGTIPPALAEGKQATEIALDSPRNVAVDSAGNFYFSDFGGHRVWQVTAVRLLMLVAGTGRPAFSGDTGASWAAEVNSPAGVAADRWGALYIADSGNHRIRRVYRGMISTLPIVPVTPTGIAVDSVGDLLIADPGVNQIIRYSAGVAVPSIQPATDISVDSAGYPLVTDGRYVLKIHPASGESAVIAGTPSGIPPSGPATGVRLWNPTGVAHDGATLYFSDTANHRVLSVTSDGATSPVAGTGTPGSSAEGERAGTAQLNIPWGIAAGGGTLYIVDRGNHVIRVVSGDTIRTFAGNGEAGYSGDFGPPASVRFRSPTFAALDGTGNLYVSDTGNHCIRRITTSGMVVTIAGDGVSGFDGDGGPAVRARLNSPLGIAVGPDGAIYIADSGNNRIRRIGKPESGRDPVIESIPDAPIWRNPTGLALAADGALLVTDADDQRIFRFEPDSGRISTIAGTGEAGFAGDGGLAQASVWNRPAGIEMALDGAIYVADSGNDRIRKVAVITDGPPEAQVPGNVVVLHAATGLPGPVAPGQLVLFDIPAPADSATPAVLVDGAEIPVLDRNRARLTVQVPASVTAPSTALLELRMGAAVVGGTTLQIVPARPEFFRRDGQQVSGLNEDGSPNLPAAPADRGSILSLFATGDGGGPVEIRFGGYLAEILYSGPAPGYPGVTQINARVPGGFLAPGQVPVTIAVGEFASTAETFVSVR